MNDRFLRACRREKTDTTPIWLMRQAGRYMAESTAPCVKSTRSSSCAKTPDLAAQVTLQPLRLGVDAAILFADILLPLEPMGAPFEFAKGEGPVIHAPVRIGGGHRCAAGHGAGGWPRIRARRHPRDQERAHGQASAHRLPRAAPFTLASYLVEGGKSAHFVKTKRLMYAEPDAWNVLMSKLAEVVLRYLTAQVRAGADAIQLFDSWVGQLSREDYREYVLPHTSHASFAA